MSWWNTRPMPFPGTDEQRRANEGTHVFMLDYDGTEYRCGNCDRRDGSVSAGWPCGMAVPREAFEVE